MIHKQAQKIIGASGYNDRSVTNEGLYEIGYWCDIDYQGQGLVTEYANALTRYAFDVLSASKVVITMQIENKKSIAVAERLNFYNEGTKKRDPADCVSEEPAQNYIYSVHNTDKLPDLAYSNSDASNEFKDHQMINWAKDTLEITDKKAFAASKAIVKTPWSKVLEINTGNEIIYIKQTPEMFSLELKIIQFLEEGFNAPVPQVMAKNDNLNCFLMKNAGIILREVLRQDFIEELLFKTIEQFTLLQIEVADHVNTLLEMGVPDYRLEQIPNLYIHLIQQKDLLIAEGLSETEINWLEEMTATVYKLCKQLAGYSVKQTIVQPDFNDNNTLVDEQKQKITIIDLGEIVISHPFFSLLNFLHQMKKHHGLTEKDGLYLRLKDACFKNYKCCFASNEDFQDALAAAKLVNIISALVYQDRFMRACGKENL